MGSNKGKTRVSLSNKEDVMLKFCFKNSLVGVLLLTLSVTSLLATPLNQECQSLLNLPARTLQTTREHSSIEDLPEEIHLRIFSYINQKDIPSVTRTRQRWQRLMEDNQLWKGYAKRALLIMEEDLSQERNYKSFVKEHCFLSFTDLGFLNGGTESSAQGISFDGSVVVGAARDGAVQDQGRAFRWTAEKGMESLGTLNGGSYSSAYGINYDGAVVVGAAGDGMAQDQERAFRWTAEKGMESLGTLNEGTENWAQGISSDGSVIVGIARDGAAQDQRRAFRWTAEKGMESLGTLNGGSYSSARGISSDAVIVGIARDGAAQGQLGVVTLTQEEYIFSDYEEL
jgi:probable HAF family extracellular repeat protein